MNETILWLMVITGFGAGFIVATFIAWAAIRIYFNFQEHERARKREHENEEHYKNETVEGR